MRLTRSLVPLLLSLPAPAAAGADDPAATVAALQQVDARLAAIAHRLVIANVALCADRQPALGWAVQSLGQFAPGLRPAARARFGFDAPVAVEAVVAGGPAVAAGIAAGDSLVAVNGAVVEEVVASEPSAATRDALEARLAALPPDRPIELTLSRGGRVRRVTVAPVPACRSRFEVLLARGYEAQADGRIVQIGVRYFEDFGDAEVAVIVAHELAHNVLRHRARLAAAGARHGLLAEVGRNGRLFRAAEAEADRLSVYLLHNAGYAAADAARFWRDKGDAIDGGLFRSRTHYGAKTRARQIEAEAALIAPSAPRPIVPPLLANRDTPL